ncbi:46279_t:CDS:2, partial [Gigaspora margarita]
LINQLDIVNTSIIAMKIAKLRKKADYPGACKAIKASRMLPQRQWWYYVLNPLLLSQA